MFTFVPVPYMSPEIAKINQLIQTIVYLRNVLFYRASFNMISAQTLIQADAQLILKYNELVLIANLPFQFHQFQLNLWLSNNPWLFDLNLFNPTQQMNQLPNNSVRESELSKILSNQNQMIALLEKLVDGQKEIKFQINSTKEEILNHIDEKFRDAMQFFIEHLDSKAQELALEFAKAIDSREIPPIEYYVPVIRFELMVKELAETNKELATFISQMLGKTNNYSEKLKITIPILLWFLQYEVEIPTTFIEEGRRIFKDLKRYVSNHLSNYFPKLFG